MGEVADSNFIAYTFCVDGSRERYDLVYSIIERFHQGENGTRLIRDDQDNAELEDQTFVVYSELRSSEYDADSIDLQVLAALDVLKLQLVIEHYGLNLPLPRVYGAVQTDYVWMKLFSIGLDDDWEGYIHFVSAPFGEEEGEFDLGFLNFHTFEYYFSPEGVNEIRTFLEEHEDDDEMDVQSSSPECWFNGEHEPRASKTVMECLEEFASEITQFDDLL